VARLTNEELAAMQDRSEQQKLDIKRLVRILSELDPKKVWEEIPAKIAWKLLQNMPDIAGPWTEHPNPPLPSSFVRTSISGTTVGEVFFDRVNESWFWESDDGGDGENFKTAEDAKKSCDELLKTTWSLIEGELVSDEDRDG
jgi:hypothetical protein